MHINIFRISFIFCIVAILYLATTIREIEVVSNNWDKLNHIFAFILLYILLSVGYEKRVFINVLFLLLYGILIEVIQYFIPNREFSILDIFADLVGIFIGYLFICIYKKIKQELKGS